MANSKDSQPGFRGRPLADSPTSSGSWREHDAFPRRGRPAHSAPTCMFTGLAVEGSSIMGAVFRLFPRGLDHRDHRPEEDTMKGHIKKRGDRYYAVIYEGLDPVTGEERRTWHPRRHRPCRRRAARREARGRGDQAHRQGPFADLRRVPDEPVDLGQEAPARHEHLPGIRAQRQRHLLPVLGRISIRRPR